ncbi:MAG: hypothetical protein ACHQFX_12605 [Chitinophagales bacterium]
MKWLLFLSRLSFICGCCFLIAFSFQVFNKTNNDAVSSTIIIIGFVIGLIVVPATLISYLGVLMVRKKIPVPAWLVISNIIFLFVLMLYLIFINVESNHPS